MRTRLTLAAIAAVGLLAAACGGGSDNNTASGGSTRRVEIDMRDIAFSPASITVQAGETVEFVFRNTGAVAHDAYIGDEDGQRDHEMEMNSTSTTGMAGMDHHGGGDADAITVEPGDTGTLTHTFESGDQLLIGCHQPGHYAAGMRVNINLA